MMLLQSADVTMALLTWSCAFLCACARCCAGPLTDKQSGPPIPTGLL